MSFSPRSHIIARYRRAGWSDFQEQAFGDDHAALDWLMLSSRNATAPVVQAELRQVPWRAEFTEGISILKFDVSGYGARLPLQARSEWVSP